MIRVGTKVRIKNGGPAPRSFHGLTGIVIKFRTSYGASERKGRVVSVALDKRTMGKSEIMFWTYTLEEVKPIKLKKFSAWK